jgi:hypothetical protein
MALLLVTPDVTLQNGATPESTMTLLFLALGVGTVVLFPSLFYLFQIWPQHRVFGIQGASWFLGASEWLFGALLLLGLGNKKLGILGAAGSCVTFIMTFTILPFMPDGWNADAGGFPAMQGNVAVLMKDLVLFAVSFYLLKQDVERVALKADAARPSPK